VFSHLSLAYERSESGDRTKLHVVSVKLEPFKQRSTRRGGQDGLVVALSLGRCTVTPP
jgi:hypothetical protein